MDMFWENFVQISIKKNRNLTLNNNLQRNWNSNQRLLPQKKPTDSRWFYISIPPHFQRLNDVYFIYIVPERDREGKLST